MTPSENCYNLIKQFEGFRADAYPDAHRPKPVWTIGYGHTGHDVAEGDVISEEDASKLLVKDVATASSTVCQAMLPVRDHNNKLIEPGFELNQNQFDALVSFTFNVGGFRFMNSGVYKYLNQGDPAGAAEFLKKYIYAGTIALPGLVERREREYQLFMKPMEEIS